MSQLQIVVLEAAINRCRLGVRTLGAGARPDLDALATLYGSMIYKHQDAVLLEEQGEEVQRAFETWRDRDGAVPGSGA
jgi:hypothetical protein